MQYLTSFMSLELRCTQPETDLNGGYMAKLKIVKWEKDNDLKTEIFGLQDPENGELKQVAFLVTDPDKFSIFKHFISLYFFYMPIFYLLNQTNTCTFKQFNFFYT